jgi:hypothetical protein
VSVTRSWLPNSEVIDGLDERDYRKVQCRGFVTVASQVTLQPQKGMTRGCSGRNPPRKTLSYSIPEGPDCGCGNGPTVTKTLVATLLPLRDR